MEEHCTMFSAFKRLAGKSDGVGNVSPRPAHQSMPTTLQRKFAKGVQYNSEYITLILNKNEICTSNYKNFIFSENYCKG